MAPPSPLLRPRRSTGGWCSNLPSCSGCSRTRCAPSFVPRRPGLSGCLIPLVTRTELLDFAIATVEQARNELLREGLEFGEDVPLGVTIEVAAVVPLVAAWSEQRRFLRPGNQRPDRLRAGIDRDDPVGAGRRRPPSGPDPHDRRRDRRRSPGRPARLRLRRDGVRPRRGLVARRPGGRFAQPRREPGRHRRGRRWPSARRKRSKRSRRNSCRPGRPTRRGSCSSRWRRGVKLRVGHALEGRILRRVRITSPLSSRCSSTMSRYGPLCGHQLGVRCRPRRSGPASRTRIRSALRIVLSRWAMTNDVRPRIRAARPVLDQPLALGVEVAGRLVEDEDLRVGQHGAGDRQPLRAGRR